MDTATENVAEDTGVENTSDENINVENTSTNETNETVNETVNVGNDGLLDETEKSHKSIPRDQLEKQTINLKKDGKIQEMSVLEAQKLINKDLPDARATISQLQEQNNQLQQQFKEQLYNIQKQNQDRFNEFIESNRTNNTERAKNLYDEFNKNLDEERERQDSDQERMHLRGQIANSEFNNFLREKGIDENNYFAKRIDKLLYENYNNPEVYNDYKNQIGKYYRNLTGFTVESAEHLPLQQQEEVAKSLMPKMSEDKQLELIGGLEGLKKLTAHYRKSNASTVQKKETTTKSKEGEIKYDPSFFQN